MMAQDVELFEVLDLNEIIPCYMSFFKFIQFFFFYYLHFQSAIDELLRPFPEVVDSSCAILPLCDVASQYNCAEDSSSVTHVILHNLSGNFYTLKHRLSFGEKNI
jgi:hypothetical protein